MKDRAARPRSLVFSALAFITFLLLAAAVKSGVTVRFDNAVSAMVHESAGSNLTSFAIAVSFLGRLLVLIPATAVILVWLSWARWRSSALALGLAMGGGLLLNWLIKSSFHRLRPQPYFGVNPETFSFPSGHVLLAFCFYGAVLLILNCNRKLSPLAFVFGTALVLAIAWSRVYLGVHYPTDVAAGFLVAISWLGALLGVGHFNCEVGLSRRGEGAS